MCNDTPIRDNANTTTDALAMLPTYNQCFFRTFVALLLLLLLLLGVTILGKMASTKVMIPVEINDDAHINKIIKINKLETHLGRAGALA